MSVPISIAPISYVLLLIIPAISLYALFVDQKFGQAYMFHMESVVRRKQYHRLITSAFLHGDVGHLLVNMITFFFFGPIVEAIFGTVGFLIIFLGAQLGAEGLTILTKHKNLNYRAVGASGAISGMLLAFCVYAPLEKVYVFFAIPMPAIVFAGLYLGYSTLAMGGHGRVAHEAHLGGAIAGAAIAFFLLPT